MKVFGVSCKGNDQMYKKETRPTAVQGLVPTSAEDEKATRETKANLQEGLRTIDPRHEWQLVEESNIESKSKESSEEETENQRPNREIQARPRRVRSSKFRPPGLRSPVASKCNKHSSPSAPLQSNRGASDEKALASRSNARGPPGLPHDRRLRRTQQTVRVRGNRVRKATGSWALTSRKEPKPTRSIVRKQRSNQALRPSNMDRIHPSQFREQQKWLCEEPEPVSEVAQMKGVQRAPSPRKAWGRVKMGVEGGREGRVRVSHEEKHQYQRVEKHRQEEPRGLRGRTAKEIGFVATESKIVEDNEIADRNVVPSVLDRPGAVEDHFKLAPRDWQKLVRVKRAKSKTKANSLRSLRIEHIPLQLKCTCV